MVEVNDRLDDMVASKERDLMLRDAVLDKVKECESVSWMVCVVEEEREAVSVALPAAVNDAHECEIDGVRLGLL